MEQEEGMTEYQLGTRSKMWICVACLCLQLQKFSAVIGQFERRLNVDNLFLEYRCTLVQNEEEYNQLFWESHVHSN